MIMVFSLKGLPGRRGKPSPKGFKGPPVSAGLDFKKYMIWLNLAPSFLFHQLDYQIFILFTSFICLFQLVVGIALCEEYLQLALHLPF